MKPPAFPADRRGALRAWFEIAPDAMIAVDEQGRIVLANARAEQLFGYGAGGLHELRLEALVPEPLRHAHVLHRRGFNSDPRVRPMGIGHELQGRKRDGSTFPVEVGLSPLQTGEGVITIASVRDISETRRVRQALDRSRRDTFMVQIGRLALESTDYEMAVRRIPEMVLSALGVQAVAVFSTDWRRSDLHARAATGLSSAEADAIASILSDGQFILHFFVTREHAAITSEEMQLEEFAPVRIALAELGYRDVAMVPLFGRHEPMGMLVALDSHVHGFERDKVVFLQSVANLLAAAVQRSRTEAQLSHAQKLEAVGQLTGGIAHDFNNLLTVISGNLQLLESELPDNQDLQAIIASALRAVDRGADLTRRLLAFARRQPLQPRPVVPQPLLQELGHMLRRTLGEQIAVEVDCPPGVPDVYADANQLDAALINLALNARDAMPRGGCLTIVAREIAVEAADNAWKVRPGRYVSFAISDTGTGMSPEVRAHALEPFFTTKEAGKGSGLGLSMVYGFVAQSEGGMTLETRLGYGTQVNFLLPVAGPRHEAPADRQVARAPSRAGHETILVVEDEADVGKIAVRFLSAIGYHVLSAGSTREALELLIAPTRVDVLFSDVVLGSGMNGIELAHEARRLRPHLAVLLTSGYPGSDAAKHEPAATDEFELLRKPYRREELADAIRRAIDRA